MIDLVQSNWTLGVQRFDQECDKVGRFLDRNPTCFKVALFASHLFRSSSMYGMMKCLPFSLSTNLSLMLGSSVLYRSAIERFCSFRFTMPSFVGGAAMWMGRNAAISILSKTAFSSLSAFFSATLGMACLAGYLVMAYSISNADVEKYMSNYRKKMCCH